MTNSHSANLEQATRALDAFQIEIPSWGFANTGTRFGKFVQAGAASTLEEKFSDAAEVMRLTGATPTMALHVLWDLPNGLADIPEVKTLERQFGIRAGIDQSESFSGSGIQVRITLQPVAGDSRTRARSRS